MAMIGSPSFALFERPLEDKMSANRMGPQRQGGGIFSEDNPEGGIEVVTKPLLRKCSINIHLNFPFHPNFPFRPPSLLCPGLLGS
jgi:hypothetical protein